MDEQQVIFNAKVTADPSDNEVFPSYGLVRQHVDLSGSTEAIFRDIDHLTAIVLAELKAAMWQQFACKPKDGVNIPIELTCETETATFSAQPLRMSTEPEENLEGFVGLAHAMQATFGDKIRYRAAKLAFRALKGE